jgi:GrpB-like predicted nucleotidyltransferase (UPF0157 family)
VDSQTAREKYGGGTIDICDYDPGWPAQFEQERDRLRMALGSAIAIEHIGSTAVPGLAAKPIIDLLLAVRSLEQAWLTLPDRLVGLGYRQMVEYEQWLPDEMLFRRGVPGPWTHHAHVVEERSDQWQEYIEIRDYLRRHDDIATAYGELKRALALLFGDDIAGFRDAKRPFLREVRARARSEDDHADQTVLDRK